MVLGSRTITTRYLHAPQVQSYSQEPSHMGYQATTPAYRQASFDPFSQDFTSMTHHSSNLKASSSPFVPTTTHERKTPSPTADQPRSSPSVGDSSDTRVSSLSVSAGSKSDDTQLGPHSFGGIGVKTESGVVGKSKMHDRWLSAGMRKGDDKWFKSTAWCELFLSSSLMHGNGTTDKEQNGGSDHTLLTQRRRN